MTVGKLVRWAKEISESNFHLDRLNIGPRLTLCFLAIILALLLGNAVLLWQFRQVRAQGERLTGVDQELVAVLQTHISLMSFYERLDTLAHSESTGELVNEAETIRNALLQNRRRTRNALGQLSSEVQPDPALLPTLLTIQDSLPAELEGIISLAKSRDWEAVRLRLSNQVRPLEVRSEQLVENIDREVGEERAQAVLNIARAQRKILFIVPITLLMTLLFAAFLGLAVTRSITHPLRLLMQGSQALARGEFSHRVPSAGEDEFGRLGNVFNDTIVRLQELYRELERKESYLAEAQLLSHTGSFGWDVSSGKIQWSLETFRIFEYAPGSEPTIEAVMQRTHPEDRLSLRKRMERASREREEIDLEHRLLMPDGSVKHLHVVGRPATDGSDRVEFLGAVTDITDRKRAEEELQQLVDFVPQIVVVLSAEGKVIYANRVAREYTGMTLDEYRSVDVVGRVIHPGDVESMRVIRKQGLSGNDPFEVEARTLRKDGVYQWFLYRYNPLVDQGRVRRWYATGTEIESRKQEEERMRRENVRLEERTRIAQELHDTLLQSVLGASMQLDAAMKNLPPGSPVKPKLEQILELMEQGIEEGRATIQGLRSSDSCPWDLVLALSGVRRELAVRSDVDFRVSVEGCEQPVQPAIRQEIYRIGKEALVNAFYHSGAKQIDCKLEYTDTELHMRVRDNGCGIDPRVLDSGREGHWGLAGMRERATRIGAVLKISSCASAGTEIELSVPSRIAFMLSPSDDGTRA